MLQRLTIPKTPPSDPALDQRALYASGLEYVRELSRLIWTDHNLHDPGITTLELLCYALTDLSYRAGLPVEDLLASSSDSSTDTLFTARQILVNRALTSADYRKLLIDLPEVRNAWIEPVERVLYVDPIHGTLHTTPPAVPTFRTLRVRGLYRARVDFAAEVQPGDRAEVLAKVQARLQANRNLCEDFLEPAPIETTELIVCAELELAADADVARVQAAVFFALEQFLSPPVLNYSLSELSARENADGTPRTAAEIVRGPALDSGYIDDDELANSELRGEVLLSDVISVIMDVEGVEAIRDVIVNARGNTEPIADKWRLAIPAGHRPTLNREDSRLLCRKRAMPLFPDPARVDAELATLQAAQTKKRVSAGAGELDRAVPEGRARLTVEYYSFQNHFPALYGLSEAGLASSVGAARKALSYQLKGYLLFFDQLMANYCAQLAHVKELLSSSPALDRSYFHQAVKSFADWREIYDEPDIESTRAALEPEALAAERRGRFLDHLIARFAERFHDYASVMASLPGTHDLIADKCSFLQSYPATSAARGGGYDQTLASWNTHNVSGVEQRVARLLGIADDSRRDLDAGSDEGMLLIENILLRMADFAEPRAAVCADPTCSDCPDDDPYSYRVHVLLPAEAGRFRELAFRRFAEELIRQEMPAHVLPRICWVDGARMRAVQDAYKAWLEARADASAEGLDVKLAALLDALATARSVYPTATLTACEPGDTREHFVLGRTRLASEPEPS